MSDRKMTEDEQRAAIAGLTCLSKDGGRTFKWGMADRDGWPGTDDIGWPWYRWEVDPAKAIDRLAALSKAPQS
jgi:hypothetical protein